MRKEVSPLVFIIILIVIIAVVVLVYLKFTAVKVKKPPANVMPMPKIPPGAGFIMPLMPSLPITFNLDTQ